MLKSIKLTQVKAGKEQKLDQRTKAEIGNKEHLVYLNSGDNSIIYKRFTLREQGRHYHNG